MANSFRCISDILVAATSNLGIDHVRAGAVSDPPRLDHLSRALGCDAPVRGAPFGGECGHVRWRQRDRAGRASDDGAGPAARLPRYAQLYSGPLTAGGREREAGAPAVVGAAQARGPGNEEGHSVAGRGPIP